MFLLKATYIGQEKREALNEVADQLGVQSERVSRIEEQVCYWRKANQIHNWFVTHVQDGVDECQLSRVTKEELQELLELVSQVLKEKSLAPKLLPTREGFFFGSTEYDRWYWEDLLDTQQQLSAVLDEDASDGFYYQSSW